MINSLISVLLLILSLMSCSDSKSKSPAQIISVQEIPSDFMMPKQLLKIVEEELLFESKILAPVYSYIPLQILFSEKTSGTLISPSVLLSLPKGGGLVDFQSFIQGKGTFFMSFPKDQFKTLPELSHLYFVSLTPKLKIESEEFGIGCGKWIDLKSQFADLQKVSFLNLNTTENRHILVAAGHYIFVFRQLNQVYLTQVTVSDSKNNSLFCPQLKEFSL